MQDNDKTFRIVILISGFGSNLQAIIDAVANKKLDVTIAAVISDQAQAYGLQRAQQATIPTRVIEATNYSSRQAYDQALATLLSNYQPDLIVLSGFMRVLGKAFVEHFQEKIINIHPSLLPKYKGLATYQKALQANDTWHGTTVHYVTDQLDAGEIIAQMRIAIHSDDNEASLKKRTQALEHYLYPLVIQWFASGEIHNKQLPVMLDGH